MKKEIMLYYRNISITLKNIFQGDDLCHVDPSKLLLESIGRGFFFNYSCEGYNSVGWGPRSVDKELVVSQ